MPRRYIRRYYGGRDKYSIEQTAGQLSADEGGDANVIVVPAADLQGMRKVKHLTLTLAAIAGPTSAATIVYWAIVYVPEGYNPKTLNLTGTGLYEPNQFVMNCGVLNVQGGPNRISSPISRNLNGGDRIYLILKASASGYTFQYVARYAITLQ